ERRNRFGGARAGRSGFAHRGRPRKIQASRAAATTASTAKRRIETATLIDFRPRSRARLPSRRPRSQKHRPLREALLRPSDREAGPLPPPPTPRRAAGPPAGRPSRRGGCAPLGVGPSQILASCALRKRAASFTRGGQRRRCTYVILPSTSLQTSTSGLSVTASAARKISWPRG